jgi:hypothetical protein
MKNYIICDFREYEKTNEFFSLIPKNEKKDAIKLLEDLETLRNNIKEKEVFSKYLIMLGSIKNFYEKHYDNILKRNKKDEWIALSKGLKSLNEKFRHLPLGDIPDKNNMYFSTLDLEERLPLYKFEQLYDKEGNFIFNTNNGNEYNIKPYLKKTLEKYLVSNGDMNLITLLKKCYY